MGLDFQFSLIRQISDIFLLRRGGNVNEIPFSAISAVLVIVPFVAFILVHIPNNMTYICAFITLDYFP